MFLFGALTNEKQFFNPNTSLEKESIALIVTEATLNNEYEVTKYIIVLKASSLCCVREYLMHVK